MGNTLTGELIDSWNEADVRKWKETAWNMQQCTYLQFEGSQFHDITDLSVDLSVTKICFAIYGPPTEEAKTLEVAYSKEQREFGRKCYDKIREVWGKAPEKKFKLGFVFVFCKEGEKEYQVPLFRLLWETKNSVDFSRYIDTSMRVYESAQDWKDNNHLPMMKYCYPTTFSYTRHSGWSYEYDPTKEITVEFNTSPACNLASRIARVADVIITAVGMTVGVAAIFTPVGFISGPVLLSVGVGSAGWGVGRASQRLIDKANHGESLSDLESTLLWLSIAAAPLNFLNGFVGARLAAGAAGGRIFSQTHRVLATLLMLTVVGVDSFSFILNLSNLIDKANNKQLTTLDVLQFSVSTLFFGNMLIQPKTATGIIEKAQQQRIHEISTGMTDAEAQKAFKSYLETNKGDGGIKDTSKIVRNLNKMEDPNFFFKSVNDFKEVKIGGKKGNTNLVSNGPGSGETHRVNPNKRTQFTKNLQSGTPKVNKPAELKSCLGGKEYKDHKHLGKLNNQQTGRLNKVFGGAAKYDEHIVDFATKLADEMKMTNNPDGFMSLVEIVAAQAKKDPNFARTGNVKNFLATLMKDLNKVREISSSKTLSFPDEFKALYHYRKHGEEFMKFCTPEFYLGKLPGNVQNQGNLADVCQVTTQLPNGTTEVFTRKTYLRHDDSMLVIIEKDNLKSVSTIYKKPEFWTEYKQRFETTNTPPPDASFANLAFVAGLDAVQLQLRSSSFFFRNSEITERDPNYEQYKRMIGILAEDMANVLAHEKA
ncbi:unnamed protein product [Caenorhabditis sp. 36 PRJEB53466]|nr:unnamed protein product [Caenorhabditis sp. 36 PRJEB53466]